MSKVRVTRRRPYEVVSGHLILGLKDSESPSGVSLTEPNQVQSLSDLLVGRNRGIVPTFFNGTYSEYDTEDIQKMDFVELRDYRERVQAHAERLENEFKALTNQMEQRRNQEVDSRIQAILFAEAQKNPTTSNTSP